jgi:hypothetical protein
MVMAVILVGERRQERQGEQREDGSRQYRRIFYVQTDRVTDGQMIVLQASALPQLFDGYNVTGEIDLQARCIHRAPKQIGPRNWEVEIEYDTKRDKKTQKDPKDDSSGNQTDPNDWWPKVSVTYEISQKPCTTSMQEPTSQADGKPAFIGVVNSAGEPFDPPVMMDIATPVLTFELSKQAFNWLQVADYVNAVNSDNFWGAQPRQFKICQISTPGLSSRSVNQQTVYYYPVTIEMKFKRETWDIDVLDAGTYYLDGGAKKAFLTAEGQPYIGRLDGAGAALGIAAADKFKTFRVYAERPFAALNLPAQMP